MTLRRSLLLVFAVSAVGIGATGCDIFTLAGASAKLAADPNNPPIGDLTADEIRVLSQAAVAALGTGTPFTQAQADALVKFMDANNVQNQNDLNTFDENNPPAGLEDLANAFGSVDPNNFDPNQLQAVFGQVFGG